MLHYIYTAETPDNLDTINADLLYIAAKYQLVGLVTACEDSLLDTMTPVNALRTLVILDRHSLCVGSTSRREAIKYVAENILAVMETEDWADFSKQQEQLTTEVISCMAIKNNIQKVEKTSNKVQKQMVDKAA